MKARVVQARGEEKVEEEKAGEERERGGGFFGISDGRRAIGGPMTDKTSSFSTWFRVVRDKRPCLGVRVSPGASLNLDRKIRARTQFSIYSENWRSLRSAVQYI